MYRNQAEQIRRNCADFDQRIERVLAERPEFTRRAESAVESSGGGSEMRAMAEAIVLGELRPAYFIREAGIDLADAISADETLLDAVTSAKTALERAAESVGRVDLTHHFTHAYGGTGFLIDKDIVVTNRHVADMFAQRIRGGYRFRRGRFGEEMEARLDYRHLDGSNQRKRAEVTEVLYIARDHEPDFALLRVEALPDVAPLILATAPVQPDAPVAVIGYPGEDGRRNDPETMDRIFREVYEVKRLAPGFVTAWDDGRIVLMADYSSLGGNSGSPVIRVDRAVEVVGLHFSGLYLENNYAVAADVIAGARREVTLVRPLAGLAPEAPVTPVRSFAGRNGYDPDFLGAGPLSVPLPATGRWDIAPVTGASDGVLRYRNFSVLQCASRRLPLVTAVNIDGAKAKVLKREGDWRLDGRIAAAHQVGNALYAANPLDRGHMVRRRDPGWGSKARQAEADTFHYTNSAPQHEDLNQVEWLGLEDYILEAAETRDFRVSVLTGPVFRDSDRALKSGASEVRIPEEFWKIAVMVHSGTGKLSATGYVLSHGPLIRDLVESPFVLGAYKTYQVQIARIERETGLDFGTLRNADPLGAALRREAPFANVARVIQGPDSLTLGPVA